MSSTSSNLFDRHHDLIVSHLQRLQLEINGTIGESRDVPLRQRLLDEIAVARRATADAFSAAWLLITGPDTSHTPASSPPDCRPSSRHSSRMDVSPTVTDSDCEDSDLDDDGMATFEAGIAFAEKVLGLVLFLHCSRIE